MMCKRERLNSITKLNRVQAVEFYKHFRQAVNPNIFIFSKFEDAIDAKFVLMFTVKS